MLRPSPNFRLRSFLTVVLCMITGPAVWPQNPEPITDPFVVQLTGDHHLSESTLGASGQGHFVAVWKAYSYSPVRSRLRGQRLDIDGSWVGPEFFVAFEPSGTVMAPDVGMSEAGNFVIVWDQGTDIWVQRYHASGSQIGPQVGVNIFSTGDQLDSDVAVHPSGSFVVTWSSRAADGQVLAQRFGSNGQFLGEPIVVVPVTEGERQRSRIAMDVAGDFVVVWQYREDSESLRRIEGRRYGSDGQPQGESFEISPSELSAADEPSVARHADGRFVVAWSDVAGEEAGRDIVARRFDSSGLPLDDPFRVNTDTAGDQTRPRLYLEEDGGFQVVWLHQGEDSASSSVRGRSVSAQGHPWAAEWSVSSPGADAGTTPDIALSGGGQFMVVWADGGQFNDILGRSFRAEPFFQDGFESSDTSAWSAASP